MAPAVAAYRVRMQMDAFEFNKIVGATTGALMIFLVITFGTEMYFDKKKHAGHGDGDHSALAYSIEIEEEEEVAEADAEPEISLAALLASADIGKGEKVFNKCKACHNVEQGGGNKTGPALWAVMGRDIGVVDGFNYSGSLPADQGAWTWENMNAFLTKPSDWAPGTSMAFGGLRKAEDRANLMAWMNSMSDAPLPALVE